jgi:hypothetical protein
MQPLGIGKRRHTAEAGDTISPHRWRHCSYTPVVLAHWREGVFAIAFPVRQTDLPETARGAPKKSDTQMLGRSPAMVSVTTLAARLLRTTWITTWSFGNTQF